MKLLNIRTAFIAFALLILAGIVWNFSQTTVAVQTAKVIIGPLSVAIEEDGKTRIKERYTISSPLLGTLLRIDLEPGDRVYSDKTQVAILQPTSPNLLDERQKAEAEANRKGAEIAIERSASELQKIQEALTLAEKNRERVLALRAKSSVSQQEIDMAETEFRVQRAALVVAQLTNRIAEFEFEQSEAALLHHISETAAKTSLTYTITSPIDGEVLRVFHESRGVVQPGTPLLEIGDPSLIEIEVDVLSNDAVKVSVGNEVVIEQWGQDKPLHGIVRRVEPAAYTKVSSLGVEEQRVNVLIDIVEPASERSSLGDGFQVNTKIIYWKNEKCLQVPVGALVRQGAQWGVFLVRNQRVSFARVKVGERNREHAEILSGLEVGDEVVVYPSDEVIDGSRVTLQK